MEKVKKETLKVSFLVELEVETVECPIEEKIAKARNIIRLADFFEIEKANTMYPVLKGTSVKFIGVNDNY